MTLETPSRREQIAEGAIALIAEEGLRALTHRAIDARLGFPAGSTSYYARTRQELIALIVARLAEYTHDIMIRFPIGENASVEEATTRSLQVIEHLAETHPNHQVARFALLVDLRDQPELHNLLNTTSETHQFLRIGAIRVLQKLGAPHPESHADTLIALTDSILFDRLVRGMASPQPFLLRSFFEAAVREDAEQPAS